MITGDSNWNAALAAAWKRPLFSLEVGGLTIVSWNPADGTVTGMPSNAQKGLLIGDMTTQSIDELQGTSSIGGIELDSIDPRGVIRPLVASGALLGQTAVIKLGFDVVKTGLAPLAYSEFVVMHTLQVLERPGWTSSGTIHFNLSDPIRFHVYRIFEQGGPAAWAPGDPVAPQPVGATWSSNGQPVSSDNPLWLQGNPIDVMLAVFQNYLGLGQTQTNPENWTYYVPLAGAGAGLYNNVPGSGLGDPTTLINPNPLVDVPTALSLRDTYFAGDFISFRYTDAQVAKNILETEIYKPCGLYPIVRANGEVSFKLWKSPVSTSPVSIGQDGIFGIPEVKPWPIVNVVQARVDVDQSGQSDGQSSQQFNNGWLYWSPVSIAEWRQQMMQQWESKGLVGYRGGFYRASLYADRCFRRHGDSTPIYTVSSIFANVGIELGDYVSLSHPNLLDYETGLIGITDVLCEVISRTPRYASGTMDLELADTRFMGLTTPASVLGSAVIGTATIF